MGFDFNLTEALLPSHCNVSFVLESGLYFWGGFQHSPVDGFWKLVTILVFLQEKMSTHHMGSIHTFI